MFETSGTCLTRTMQSTTLTVVGRHGRPKGSHVTRRPPEVSSRPCRTDSSTGLPRTRSWRGPRASSDPDLGPRLEAAEAPASIDAAPLPGVPAVLLADHGVLVFHGRRPRRRPDQTRLLALGRPYAPGANVRRPASRAAAAWRSS
jgi:hypothetical protein